MKYKTGAFYEKRDLTLKVILLPTVPRKEKFKKKQENHKII